METVADDGADVRFDLRIGADAHRGEDPEALALEIAEDGAGLLHVVAVRPGAVGIVEDGGGAHQAAHLVQPLLRVGLDGLQRLFGQVDMAPGVAAESPAGALQLRDDRRHGFPLFLSVGLELRRLVGAVGLGAVAQNAAVAGEAQATLGPEGGEVRMLLHKFGKGIGRTTFRQTALGIQVGHQNHLVGAQYLVGLAHEMYATHHYDIGIGLGSQKNTDLFKGIPGSMVFYHNAPAQILGSMGLAGVAAYGLLLANRIRLLLRGGEACILVGMYYTGMLLVSMTNPGLFCPLPNAALTVLVFSVLEKCVGDPACPPGKAKL